MIIRQAVNSTQPKIQVPIETQSVMVERIDAFAHILPERFLNELLDVHPSDELEALTDATRFWDLDNRRNDLDEFGIDRQVLTLARPPIWRGIDPDDALALTQLANDEVARIADENDRFIGVGTLPFANEEYLAEYDRCIEDLDLEGVQIFSNVEGKPIDGPAFRQLYRRAADRDTPIWLHPQLHEWHEWDTEYMLHKILGWPFDTSLAMTRLAMSGVLEEHPDLTIIPHHMGAMIPHFAARIDLFHQMLVEHRDVYPYKLPEFEGALTEQLTRFTADTCRSGDPAILEDGLEFFGEGNLVFGTDYPFGPEEGRGFMRAEVRGVEQMDVDESTRSAIFGDNLEAKLR